MFIRKYSKSLWADIGGNYELAGTAAGSRDVCRLQNIPMGEKLHCNYRQGQRSQFNRRDGKSWDSLP